MRAPFAALAIIAGFTAASPARAQLALDISTVDPLTKLTADKWVQLATRLINPANVVGKDLVFMINATGEPLNAVTCGGYQLVGAAPYITKNGTIAAPATLPAWEVTAVPTEGFNTYCRKGVEATGRVSTYHGNLNAAYKSFSNSTFVVFAQPKN